MVKARQMIETAMQQGAHFFEWRHRRIDGAEFPATVLLARMELEGRRLLQATVRDITEEKRAAEALRAAKDAAEAASRAKSTFLANMSHEIRTPLNAVIGMTELVLKTPLSAQQREYLSTVKDSGEALLSVINDILDFSKIEAGKLVLDCVPFDLRESLGDTMKSLAMRRHQKNLELAFFSHPRRPPPSRRRLQPPAPDRDQPGRQRDQVHGAGRSRAGGRTASPSTARGGAALHRERHGHRHSAETSRAAIFEMFEQADSSLDPPAWRHRAGAGHCLAAGRA